jgi:hypothetical protein
VLGAIMRSLPLILALWLRAIDPALLGVAAPSGMRGVVIAVLLAAAALVMLVGASAVRSRSDGEAAPIRIRPIPPRDSIGLALEAGGLEAYWAFVRGAVLAVGLANGTLAVFAALGILALQAWTDPAARAALVDPDAAPALTTAAMKALLSSAVFLACGSILVSWLLHTALAALLWSCGLAAHPNRHASRPVELAALEPTIV